MPHETGTPASAALRRTFYTLLLTQAGSQIGSQISGLAIAIWVFGETGAATPLALVAFFGILPRIVTASFSGLLADRWDRRLVMALADAGQALGTLALLWSVASGGFELWHLYAVTLVQSAFAAFQGPAMEASITLLVPAEDRDRANALRQLTGPLGGIVAPALAGLVYAAIGVVGAIVVDLATFVVAVAVVLSLRLPRPAATREGRAAVGSIWREAAGGFAFLWAQRPLFFLLLHVSVVNFLLGGTLVVGLPYLLARTGSETAVGVLLGVMNLGALVGGLLMGVWGGTRRRIHTILPGLAATAGFLVLGGMSQATWLLALAFFGMMVPVPMINASFASMLQAKVPPDLQGRVFAAIEQIALLMMPAAFLIAGPLVDGVFEPAVASPAWRFAAPWFGDGAGAGMGLLLAIGGALTCIGTLAVYALPRVRSLETSLPDFAPAVAGEGGAESAETATAAEPASPRPAEVAAR